MAIPTTPPSLPGVPLVESPFFETEIENRSFSNHERRIAYDLYEKGYSVLKFPDDNFNDIAERLIGTLQKKFDIETWKTTGWKAKQGLRLQDGWKDLADVKSLAANAQILRLLKNLYGREAFPFQTLNFPVGTQQRPHSDAVHFSTMPERFMVGVWVALEDIGPDQGPLVYYPGSHKWPIIYNQMIDTEYKEGTDASEDQRYKKYIQFWQAMVKEHKIEPEYFHAKKGEALIWSSNILHGGSAHNDPEKTRWSQVTHYYFKDCLYYTPVRSNPAIGDLYLRKPVNVVTGKPVSNTYLGKEMT